MRIYPDQPGRRIDLMARDLAVALALVLFALIAIEVHDAVDKLAVLGEGVESAERDQRRLRGGGRRGRRHAADRRRAGRRAPRRRRRLGGEVQDLGRGGAGAAHDLANLLGTFFAPPAALLLLWTLPPRIRQVRRLNAAAKVTASSPRTRRLLAMRAAFKPRTAAAVHAGSARRPRGGALRRAVAAELDQAGCARGRFAACGSSSGSTSSPPSATGSATRRRRTPLTSSRGGGSEQAGLEVEADAGWEPDRADLGGAREVWTGPTSTPSPARAASTARSASSGLEAVERLGLPGLGVVVFRDEERGCAGSRGCTARPDAYVEAPHRAGPTLLRADAPLGVVTAIVGYVRGRRTFAGTPGHAGTTPMDGREDALVEAAEFVLRARDVARGIDGAVATVGQVAVEPGGTNVIPAASSSRSTRAPDAERLDRLAAALEIEEPIRTEPSPMSEGSAPRWGRGGGARAAGARVPLRRRPRRRHPRERGRPGRDALRPQPQRRGQP